MIERILLDMDDVCNTFSMYALAVIGCPVSPTDYGEFPEGFGYNLLDVANSFRDPDDQFTKQTFWDSLTREHWAGVPETPFFGELLEACEELVGRENIIIATSTTKDGDCLAGKLDWIHQHFPPWMHRQYIITPRKWLLGRPGWLLIDDNEDNCKLFAANGGQYIMVPRPWNTNRGFGTMPFSWIADRLLFSKTVSPSNESLRISVGH